MPKTTFSPDKQGFAFVNYWTLQPQEVDEIRRLFGDAVFSVRTMLKFLPASPPTLLRFNNLRDEMAAWVDQAVIKPYGMCGGMAFAALDYYYARLETPRGSGPNSQPTDDTPDGAQLRAYLWRRLEESLVANIATFLVWMSFLHVVPEHFPFGGGPGWLCMHSRQQWRTLKRQLDEGRPWPIGLVGTTTDPTLNHQVVATGYEDSGGEACKLYVYDMNRPGQEQTINMTLSEQELKANESCAGPRGPLQGFFCERYERNPNPPRISWP